MSQRTTACWSNKTNRREEPPPDLAKTKEKPHADLGGNARARHVFPADVSPKFSSQANTSLTRPVESGSESCSIRRCFETSDARCSTHTTAGTRNAPARRTRQKDTFSAAETWRALVRSTVSYKEGGASHILLTSSFFHQASRLVSCSSPHSLASLARWFPNTTFIHSIDFVEELLLYHTLHSLFVRTFSPGWLNRNSRSYYSTVLHSPSFLESF